ncbi:MAG: cytochrome b [Erythrobacter sp.]|uniref:cytochrome b n=1 Tax=Erythrobacter sp. TaxID=1042 RepID=UPI0025E1C6FF|nr:cytochrome b [Erythrobacter sp.]MCL9999335.1 cytochrome b [Erythrobacter sp.]
MSLNARTRYSGLAMLLHWLIAVLVIVQWRISETAEEAPTREAGGEIMANHFALGVVIFVLVALRLVWRQVSPPPPPVVGHAPSERALAAIVHFAFYALLLVMPIAGWIALSTFGEAISVWGLFSLPVLPVPQNPDLGETIFELHGASGIALLVLAAVHTLAALKHTVRDKDGTLYRMLPFGTARG